MDGNGNPTNDIDSTVLPIIKRIGSNATKGNLLLKIIILLFTLILTVSDAINDPLILNYIELNINKANEKAISRAAQVKV